MRIDRLEFHNKDSGWHLEPIEFFPDLTLLVGVSGVGKTQILNAIGTLMQIARDTTFREGWGIEWDLKYSTAGRRYCWQGECEGREVHSNGMSRDHPLLTATGMNPLPRPRILREILVEDDTPLIERNADRILLEGKQTPKLSPSEPAISLLCREERIKPAYDGLGQIAHLTPFMSVAELVTRQIKYVDTCRQFPTPEAIRASAFSTPLKLMLVYEVAPNVFRDIVKRFQQVFPQVEDLQVELIDMGPLGEIPNLRMKERGSDTWIPERRISSGMLRTLVHLSMIHLWPEGTVILIDEFENSLGVNCLDEITQHMMEQSRHLQFVLTSHHPYIINNIPSKHWKVVTRKGSLVTSHDSKELGLGRSKHEAFLQLLNSELYREGISA